MIVIGKMNEIAPNRNVRVFVLLGLMSSLSVFGQTRNTADSTSPERKKLDSSEKIEAVEIRVQKNLIENQADKLVYNAAEDVTSKGASASDLLSKVPMVEVDMDGNVSMRGNRNVRFLVNGRPSGLLTGNPADALRSLSADDIEKIEVITNPSSKYDAEGSGGIINIIMKNKKLQGSAGNMRMGLGTRSAHLGGQYSYQKGKTNVSVNLGSHFWRSWGDEVTERINTNASGETFKMMQVSDQTNWGGGPRLTVGLDYQISDRQSLIFTVSGNGRLRNSYNNWSTQLGPIDSTLAFLWSQKTDRSNNGYGYDVGFDYRYQAKKKGREFSVSGLSTQGNSLDDYWADRLDNSSISFWKERSHNLGINLENSLQMDWVEPLNANTTWESGAKFIGRIVTSDYTFDSFNYGDKNYRSIEDRNNEFSYYQNVYAVYTQLGYNFLKHYSVRVGARYEFTEFGGELTKPENSKFNGQPYANLVPSFLISRKFGMAGFVRFNYNRRIQRPSLFYLNPYTNLSDPLNIQQGNPYLEPEIGDNYELSFGNYTKVGGFGINFFHKRVDNAIETYRTVNENRVYVTTYGNIGKNRNNGFDLNMNLKGKDWSVFVNGGLSFVEISSTVDTGAVAGVSAKGWMYSMGLRANYNINEKWAVEAFGRVNAPTFSLQGYTQNWLFHTIGIKRRYNKDKWGLGFGLDNPFTPVINLKTKNVGNGFTFNQDRNLNVWGVRVNFDYKFGKVESEVKNPRELKIKNEDLKQENGQSGM